MLEDLKNFIVRAEKSRKYAANTASGIKLALSYFEKELNEDEAKSLEAFKDHFEQIYMDVFRKNDQLSPASLEIYKRRVRNLINDYEAYANDPTKFAAWNPVRIVKPKTSKKEVVTRSAEVGAGFSLNGGQSGQGDSNKVEIIMHSGKALILTPPELSSQDIKNLRSYIDYLEKFVKKADAEG